MYDTVTGSGLIITNCLWPNTASCLSIHILVKFGKVNYKVKIILKEHNEMTNSVMSMVMFTLQVLVELTQHFLS